MQLYEIIYSPHPEYMVSIIAGSQANDSIVGVTDVHAHYGLG